MPLAETLSRSGKSMHAVNTFTPQRRTNGAEIVNPCTRSHLLFDRYLADMIRAPLAKTIFQGNSSKLLVTKGAVWLESLSS